MNRYKIVVEDDLFGQFNCTIETENQERAIEIAKEHYSLEMGTDPGKITIISIEAEL